MAITSFVADRLKDLDPDYEVDDDDNYAFWAGSVIGPVVYMYSGCGPCTLVGIA